MSPPDHVTIDGPVRGVVFDRPPANAIDIILSGQIMDVREAEKRDPKFSGN